MKYMGEGLMVYRRSDTLRCFLMKADTVYGHNSGESLKWAPKVHGLSTLISQANGQSKNNMMIHSIGYIYIYWFTCKNDYTILFLRQSIFLYALAFLFTYLT